MTINLETLRVTATTVSGSGVLQSGRHTPVDAASGPITMTLPTPTHPGVSLSVEKIDTSPNTVTVTGSIRGATNSVTLTAQYQVTQMHWTGATWRVTGDHRTKAQLDATYAAFGSVGGGGGTAATATGVAATDTAIVNAAKATGLRLPPGTYVVNTITIGTGEALRGSGSGATILQLAAGQNSHVVQTTNFAALTGNDSTSTPSEFEISDITLDGNKANQSSGSGNALAIYAYGYRLTNVTARNARGYGVWTEWGSAGPFLAPNGMEAHAINTRIHDCDGGGVYHRGPHDSQWVNTIIVKNSGTISGTCGIKIPSDGFSNGSTFTNLHVYGGQYDYGLSNASSGLEFNACQFEGANIAQTIILASMNKMSECKWFPGGISPSTVKGIVIGDATHTINTLRLSGKIEDTGGGMLDLTFSGGDHTLDLTGQFAITYPATPVIGTIDQNSTVRFPIIDSTGLARSDGIFQMAGGMTVKNSLSASAISATTLSGALTSSNTLTVSLSANNPVPGTRVEVLPRMFIEGTGSGGLSSGFVSFSYFTPEVTTTVSTITMVKQGTAQAGATGARMGLYSVDGSSNLTCIARTASDATLFQGSDGLNTRAIVDNGAASPAAISNVVLTRGQRYALAVLVVGATTDPQMSRTALGSDALAFLTPILSTTSTGGQTTLAPSYASNVVSGTKSMFWGYAQ